MTNLTDARSRIEDADFSAETTNLAKAQILSQASTAMLAQANQSQQGVLSCSSNPGKLEVRLRIRPPFIRGAGAEQGIPRGRKTTGFLCERANDGELSGPVPYCL